MVPGGQHRRGGTPRSCGDPQPLAFPLSTRAPPLVIWSYRCSTKNLHHANFADQTASSFPAESFSLISSLVISYSRRRGGFVVLWKRKFFRIPCNKIPPNFDQTAPK